MNETEVVKGYKVFNSDWKCRDKQYACPSKFEEDVIPYIYAFSEKALRKCTKINNVLQGKEK